MTRRPSGGIGSNQYATKPRTASRLPSSRRDIATAVLANGGDLDPEDVAAAFDPDLQPWIKAGISAGDIGGWEEFGVGDPEEAAGWKAHGFGPEDAMYWGAEFTPTEAAHWSQAGFDAIGACMVERFVHPAENDQTPLWDIAAQACEPIGGPGWAGSWASAEFDLEDAVQWCEAGITDPALAVAWNKHVGPSAAGEWVASGVDDPEVAGAYRAAGHTPTTWAETP